MTKQNYNSLLVLSIVVSALVLLLGSVATLAFGEQVTEYYEETNDYVTLDRDFECSNGMWTNVMVQAHYGKFYGNYYFEPVTVIQISMFDQDINLVYSFYETMNEEELTEFNNEFLPFIEKLKAC